jgi:hypothetical protein
MASIDSGLAKVETATASVTPAADSTPTVETPAANTDDFSVETAPEEGESEVGKETATHNSDGTEKTDEQKEDHRAKSENRVPLPAEVRSALKSLRDSDPKNAAAVKALHGSYERWEAAKELLGPGAAGGVNGLKTYLAEIGVKTIPDARAVLARTQEMLDTVKGTDELLYAADKKLWENVYEDLKSQNKADQYGKNIENALDHLKSVDETGYYAATKPHVVSGLVQAGLPTAINSIWKALADGNTEAAKGVLSKMAEWYNNLRDEVSESGKAKSETEKLNAAKASWESDKQKAERTTVETNVATDCEKKNNTTLGKYLGGFLKMPFFKGFERPTLVDLGNGIKDHLYATLKADKSYQKQMDTLWKAKTLDRAAMIQVHEAKLQEIGERVVREVVQNRYPGYAKGGSAAGKAAAQVEKKTATAKAGAQSVALGKPIYVASRPENIVREPIKVAGRSYTSEELRTMQVAGRAFVRSGNGAVKLVTWRR